MWGKENLVSGGRKGSICKLERGRGKLGVGGGGDTHEATFRKET